MKRYKKENPEKFLGEYEENLQADNAGYPEWFILIKTRRDDYKKMYQKQLQRRFKFSFNWSAAVCGPMWFAYRKMYIESIIFSVIQTVVYFLSIYINMDELIFLIILLIINGFCGNYLYYRFLQKNYIKDALEDHYKDINKHYLIFILITYSMILSWVAFQLIVENSTTKYSCGKLDYIFTCSEFIFLISSSLYFYFKEKKEKLTF